MKRLLWIVTILLLAFSVLDAQSPQYGRFHKALVGSAVPTGSCQSGTLYYRTATNEMYICEANTWTLVAADVPAGSVSLTTDVTGILPVANGGTNNAFFTVAGPAVSAKTYTLPNASSTILTSNAAVTALQGGMAVYDSNGTQVTPSATVHMVKGTCTLGTDCVVTLAGAAAFTSTARYDCGAVDQTSAAAVQLVKTAANTITITGNAVDVISYVCVGD